MKFSKLTTKGRVTLPAELRKKYGLKPGMKIAFKEKNDQLILQPVNKKYIEELAGLLGLKGKHLKSLMEEKKIERML